MDAMIAITYLIVRAWYLDDGVLAGPKSYVLHALSIFVDDGSIFGIIINLSKCELFGHNDVYLFFKLPFFRISLVTVSTWIEI